MRARLALSEQMGGYLQRAGVHGLTLTASSRCNLHARLGGLDSVRARRRRAITLDLTLTLTLSLTLALHLVRCSHAIERCPPTQVLTSTPCCTG